MSDTDVGNWISVKNILPAEGMMVLISVLLGDGRSVCGFGTMNGTNNWQLAYLPQENGVVSGVNAWMPLPPPYTGRGKNGS